MDVGNARILWHWFLDFRGIASSVTLELLPGWFHPWGITEGNSILCRLETCVCVCGVAWLIGIPLNPTEPLFRDSNYAFNRNPSVLKGTALLCNLDSVKATLFTCSPLPVAPLGNQSRSLPWKPCNLILRNVIARSAGVWWRCPTGPEKAP